MYTPLAIFDVVQMKLYGITKIDVDEFACWLMDND